MKRCPARRAGLLLALGAVALTLACRPAVPPSPIPTPTPPPGAGILVGRPAPDFALNLFDGGVLRLSDLRGRWVVINFWASWCPPCREEMPDLQRAYEAFRGRGVVFVGVAMADALPDARRFAEEVGITYPVGLDEQGEIALAYRVFGLPTTLLVDPEGRVDWVHAGPLNFRLLHEVLGARLGGA